MSKPPIPSIENAEAVIEWFLEYDDQIKGNLTEAPVREMLKEELLKDLKEHPDAQSLKAFVKESEDRYIKEMAPTLVKKHQNNEEIPIAFFWLTIFVSAKARVFGYILLKKYGIQPDTETNNLSAEEQQKLRHWIATAEAGEMAQVQDLFKNCHSAFQFAKTHSAYIKDWEKTKQQMEANLKNGILPPGISANLHRAIIDATEKVMQKKLKMVQMLFENKFGEPIYNYLGPDGKTKSCLGVVLFFITIGTSIGFGEQIWKLFF